MLRKIFYIFSINSYSFKKKRREKKKDMGYKLVSKTVAISYIYDIYMASGNDASAPKLCLNPESSSDKGFVRSNAVVQTSVIV